MQMDVEVIRGLGLVGRRLGIVLGRFLFLCHAEMPALHGARSIDLRAGLDWFAFGISSCVMLQCRHSTGPESLDQSFLKSCILAGRTYADQ